MWKSRPRGVLAEGRSVSRHHLLTVQDEEIIISSAIRFPGYLGKIQSKIGHHGGKPIPQRRVEKLLEKSCVWCGSSPWSGSRPAFPACCRELRPHGSWRASFFLFMWEEERPPGFPLSAAVHGHFSRAPVSLGSWGTSVPCTARPAQDREERACKFMSRAEQADIC